MKRVQGLDEIHEIIEKISEEEKHLTPEHRIKKLCEEADRFLIERNLNLKRVICLKLKTDESFNFQRKRV
ncbi:MAG TPA: hypothetical protein ACFYEK_15940 [Candidatus Wunengus sp. YC60]|uniref:hypothetical protein n=1 Tax=Candidatus Wunengus sp. YC60 TaxID=3367697 RepID=UPI0040280323